MAARRCSACGVDWPTDGPIACGVCEQATDYMPNATPIGREDALSRRAHAAFERYCEAETAGERQEREARELERLRRLEEAWQDVSAQLQD